jgi:hypothetical protein
MQRTFYDLLGISTNAPQKVIKAAFREKVQQVHPDKVQAQVANLDPYAADRLKKALEEDFRDLKEAYDVLSDARQRKEYDDLLKQIGATSAPPPITPTPSQAPPPPSTSPPVNSCVTCGAPLVGNSCTACANQGTKALVSGAVAIFWILGTLLAFFVAVTLPRDSSWDADTCIGVLMLLGIVVLLAIRNGLWGGVKRLCKTRPRTGALVVEAVVLVVLSLMIGSLNSSPKVASSQTHTNSAGVKSGTSDDVKPAVPAVRPPPRLDLKTSEAGSLAGHFGGTVRNQTAGLSADFGIVIEDKGGVLSGCMAVKPPLFGSGPLSCVVYGPDVSFTVVSSIGEIAFGGRNENDGIQGTYAVRHPNGTANEEGTFVLRQVKSQGIRNTVEADCPKEEPRVTPAAPAGNVYQAPPDRRNSIEVTHQEPLPTRNNVVTTPDKTNDSVGAVSSDKLSSEETASLESACSTEKVMQGPAAYNRCLRNQLASLAAGPRRPDLSGLSRPELESIESACSTEKVMQGPAAYNRCLQNQLASLAVGPRRPDLSGLSRPELESIESACSTEKVMQGPTAYNRCLRNQLASLAAGPRRPDLSGLSRPEVESIESACSTEKVMQGPAAYNRCLLKQLDLLGIRNR